MGDSDLNSTTDDSVTLEILSSVVHPLYVEPISYYDVAVLTVESVPMKNVSQSFYDKDSLPLHTP